MLLCHLFVFFDEVSVENFDLFFFLIKCFSYCCVLRILCVL